MSHARPLVAAAAALTLLAGCGWIGADPDTGGASPPIDAPPTEQGPGGESEPGGEAEGDAPAGESDEDPAPPPDPDTELPEVPGRADAVTLSPDEVYPNAKELASAIAQAVTTYEADQPFVEALADLGLTSAQTAQLAEEAAVLHHEGRWSRGRVIYPQLGGVRDQRISVMVVTEQRIGTPDGVRTQTRTLDVRLQVVDGEWSYERLDDPGGQPPSGDVEPRDEARAVLEHDRIELPDSARWDILSGETEPLLLEVMARAADEFSFGVVTLTSGHPRHVFGTDRLSDHTRGRAVDIHLVEGTEVIDDRADGSTTRRFVEWLYDQPEVVAVGSPWALDGFGGRSFTDVVHQDHIHLAVAPPQWGQAALTMRRPASSSSSTRTQ